MAKPPRHNPIARDLRTPKYRARTVPSRRRESLLEDGDLFALIEDETLDPQDIEQ